MEQSGRARYSHAGCAHPTHSVANDAASVWFSTPRVGSSRWLISSVGPAARSAASASAVYPSVRGVVIQRRQPQVRLRRGTQSIIDAGIDVHNIAMLRWRRSPAKNGPLQAIYDRVHPAEYWRSPRVMPRANRAFISRPAAWRRQYRGQKLVETEHVGFRFKAVGDDLQRVAMSLQGGQLFVYAQHGNDAIKALFTLARQALVNRSISPGFASPHAAPRAPRPRTGAVPAAGSLTSSLPNFARKPPPDATGAGCVCSSFW